MKNNDSSETTMRPDPDALLKGIEREESKEGRLKIFLGYAPSLYTREWRLFHNFFCPSVKLISKERKGSKTIKRHDSPRTPY